MANLCVSISYTLSDIVLYLTCRKLHIVVIPLLWRKVIDCCEGSVAIIFSHVNSFVNKILW